MEPFLKSVLCLVWGHGSWSRVSIEAKHDPRCPICSRNVAITFADGSSRSIPLAALNRRETSPDVMVEPALINDVDFTVLTLSGGGHVERIAIHTPDYVQLLRGFNAHLLPLETWEQLKSLRDACRSTNVHGIPEGISVYAMLQVDRERMATLKDEKLVEVLGTIMLQRSSFTFAYAPTRAGWDAVAHWEECEAKAEASAS